MYDVGGLICESGDIVAKERMLPAIELENVIAMLDSGAYGFSIGFPVQQASEVQQSIGQRRQGGCGA